MKRDIHPYNDASFLCIENKSNLTVGMSYLGNTAKAIRNIESAKVAVVGKWKKVSPNQVALSFLSSVNLHKIATK